MVNGPPCGVCGFTLRWLPQQNGWGCDRCQRMFPASGPGAPQAAAAQQPPGPSAWAPPQQQGFAPPQQQGFRPPQQQGFAPQQPSPYAPPGQPPHGAPQPPSPYAPPGQPPHAQQPPSPYAQPGQYPPPHGQPPHGQPPYAPHGAPPGATPHGAYPAHPQQAYSPHGPAAAAPMPAPGKKSGKGLVIGLAVAAVAIAGGIVAFVMMRGGGDPKGGDSREAVVKGTLAALAAGNVDRLLALGDPVALDKEIVDCSGKTKPRKGEERDEDDDDDDDDEGSANDPDKQRERMKKELEKIVEKTKGAKIELVEIVSKEPPPPSDDEKKRDEDDEDDDDDGKRREMSFLMKSGSRVKKGCYSRVPIRVTETRIKIKVTPPKAEGGDKGEKVEPEEQEVEMMMVQVGKGWWMSMPPRISLGFGALAKEMREWRDKVCACKDYECAKKLKDDFKSSPRSREMKKEIKELDQEDEDKLEKIEDEIKACEKKLAGEYQLTTLTQFKDKICACSDKACADKVMQEMTVWSKSQDDMRPTDDIMKQATEVSKQMSDCMMKLYNQSSGGGGGIGDTIATVAGSDAPANLSPSCVDYRNLMKQLTTCEKLPPSARANYQQAMEAMDKSWKQMGQLPPESVKARDDACRQGFESLKRSATALGC